MRKLQLNLNEDAWKVLEATVAEANQDFSAGTITLSDVANELIVNAKIDVRVLQAKHANIRKALRVMATQKDIDIESAIKNLMEMKARATQRRSTKAQQANDEVSA